MKQIKLYFELFGHKNVITVEAESYELAKQKFLSELPDKVKFYENVKEANNNEPISKNDTDIFNHLKNIMNIK